MAGYAAAAAVTIAATQVVLSAFQDSLGIGAYLCPNSASIDTITSITSFDFIMVGAGEAGSILAYRLSEKFPGSTFLILEEGECPPLESLMPGYFSLMPRTSYDGAMNIYNDSFSCQNLQATDGVTTGRMLGGSGGINHLIHLTPNPKDYEYWVEATGDSSWGFPDLAEYFARGETVQDEAVLAQNTSYHGTNGPTLLNRQPSSMMKDVINAHIELGVDYKDDVDGLCIVEPLMYIGDGKRQNGNVAYLSKMIDRTNVYFLTSAVASKVIFNDTTATGVQFIFNGTTYEVIANTQVILSAGALKTPQLLQLSGIGDDSLLSKLGINTVVNNTEVGQNLMDHVTSVFGISLDTVSVTPATNPHEFPVPLVINFDALNRSQTQAEVQEHILYFTSESSAFLQVCTNVFKYIDEICDSLYEYNKESDLLLFVNKLLHPVSRGSITARTTNISDQPIIKINLLSDSKDVEDFAVLVQRYTDSMLNSTTLNNVGAKFANISLCTEYTAFSLEFWKCYIVATTAPTWHFCGTAAMGKVVDASLNVIGVKNLKVVDASAMPSLSSGQVGSSIRALAEKGADIIINEVCSTRPFC